MKTNATNRLTSIPIRANGDTSIMYGIMATSPNFINGPQKGNHRALNIPSPARKNM